MHFKWPMENNKKVTTNTSSRGVHPPHTLREQLGLSFTVNVVIPDTRKSYSLLLAWRNVYIVPRRNPSPPWRLRQKEYQQTSYSLSLTALTKPLTTFPDAPSNIHANAYTRSRCSALKLVDFPCWVGPSWRANGMPTYQQEFKPAENRNCQVRETVLFDRRCASPL